METERQQSEIIGQAIAASNSTFFRWEMRLMRRRRKDATAIANRLAWKIYRLACEEPELFLNGVPCKPDYQHLFIELLENKPKPTVPNAFSKPKPKQESF